MLLCVSQIRIDELLQSTRIFVRRREIIFGEDVRC